MFSPKVLDRANVLEFRVSKDEMSKFLIAPASPNLDKLTEPGITGVAFGELFAAAASRLHDPKLPDTHRDKLKIELMLFFSALGEYNCEFGFRVGKEISRFHHFHALLSGGKTDFRAAMDAQIVQKLLPKLHGSRNKLTGLLWTLAALCLEDYAWKSEPDETKREIALETFLKDLRTAIEAGDENYDPARIADKLKIAKKEAHYPLSFEKIVRMWRVREANGFVSFAEA